MDDIDQKNRIEFVIKIIFTLLSFKSQVWWHMAVTVALRRWRQDDQDFKPSYIVGTRLPWATWDSVSEINLKQSNKENLLLKIQALEYKNQNTETENIKNILQIKYKHIS